MKTICILAVLIFFSIFLNTNQDQIDFKTGKFSSPLHYHQYLGTYGGTIKMVLKVVGNHTHEHYKFSQPYSFSLYSGAPLTLIDDIHQFVDYSQAPVFQVVKIKQSTGFVKISMAIFSNNVKMAQYFQVALAETAPYVFIELTSTVACKFVLNDPRVDSYASWKLYRLANGNPLSTSLPTLIRDTEYDLNAGEFAYIRVPSNSGYSDNMYKILTLSTSPCQTQCPFAAQGSPKIVGLQPGQTNKCQCSFYVYDWQTKACLNCGQEENKAKQGCANFEEVVVCGNGIKETGQECDNRNQTGCIDCKKAAGYVCTEDANKLSTCNLPPPVCGNGIKETGQECDNRNQTGCIDCKKAAGYQCTEDANKLSTCSISVAVCGDSKKTASEQCDNGNEVGCVECKVSLGYSCTGSLDQKSVCTGQCGDGIRLPTEDCDSGGQRGCTNCRIDPGYSCIHNLYVGVWTPEYLAPEIVKQQGHGKAVDWVH